MEKLERRVQVDDRTAVRSVWLIPDGYVPETGCAFVLAHGAGAGMDHEFISSFHEALGAAGILTVKFNFPYKERGRKIPDRHGLLEQTYRAVLRQLREDPLAPRHLFAGGKSMGGRMSTHLAAQGLDLAGLILLGYPLHPPGRVDRLRREHLPRIQCPCLFIQGTRDALCRLDLLQEVLAEMPAEATLHVVEGGDHSFAVLKSSGRSQEEVRSEMLEAMLDWIGKRSADKGVADGTD